MKVLRGLADNNPLRNSPHRHYGTGILVTALIVPRVINFFLDTRNPFNLAANGIGVMATVVAMFLSIAHNTGPLCEKCFEALPADAAQRAKGSRRPLLFLHHLLILGGKKTPGRRSLITLGSIIALIAINFFFKANTLPSDIIGLLVSIMLSAIHVCLRTHNLYLPWCPWCRNDDGRAPAGDPDPSIKIPTSR